MQSDSESKRLRKVALTAITIATLLVLATGVSCTSSTTPVKPEEPPATALRGPKGRNQDCDTCHDAQAGDVQMQLYVFVPGKPDMDDFDAAEKMLKGADSTAMGFSSRGCLGPPAPAVRAFSLVADAGLPALGGSVEVFQAGPPPPRVDLGTSSAEPPPPPPPTTGPGSSSGHPPPIIAKKPMHPCMPVAGHGGYKLCEEPVGANGMLQPDGVVYFRAITANMNDYRFIPCKYAREKTIRSYDDVTQRLSADQWIHFTGTHSGQGPTWSVTRQP